MKLLNNFFNITSDFIAFVGFLILFNIGIVNCQITTIGFETLDYPIFIVIDVFVSIILSFIFFYEILPDMQATKLFKILSTVIIAPLLIVLSCLLPIFSAVIFITRLY